MMLPTDTFHVGAEGLVDSRLLRLAQCEPEAAKVVSSLNESLIRRDLGVYLRIFVRDTHGITLLTYWRLEQSISSKNNSNKKKRVHELSLKVKDSVDDPASRLLCISGSSRL